MKVTVWIRKRNVIREVLHSYKELTRYKQALEVLFCAANGLESCCGYINNIEDSGYRELYVKTLKKIEELRASLPSTKDSGDAG